MSEHTILVAFTVEGADRASAEYDLRYALRDTVQNSVTSWWVAEDDRRDGSDNDSAVFVTPGKQQRASVLLNAAGMTPDCNVLPDWRGVDHLPIGEVGRYDHGRGPRCVQTEAGRFLVGGRGLSEDAECQRPHDDVDRADFDE